MIRLILVLALFVTFITCGKSENVHSGQFLPIAKSGPIEWTVDGEKTNIVNTYYIAFPEGMQYTCECKVPKYYNFDNMTEFEHKQFAFPLAKFIYENEMYKKLKITKIGTGKKEVKFIGIVLFNNQGALDRGYRTQFTLDEIRSRVANEITFDVEINKYNDIEKNKLLLYEIVNYNKQYIISKLKSIHGKDLTEFRVAKKIKNDQVHILYVFNRQFSDEQLNYDEINNDIKKLVSELIENNVRFKNTFLKLQSPSNMWINDMIADPEAAYKSASDIMQKQITLGQLQQGSQEIKDNLGSLQEINFIRGEYYLDSPGISGELISMIYNLAFDNNRKAGVNVNFVNSKKNGWEVVGYTIVPL